MALLRAALLLSLLVSAFGNVRIRGICPGKTPPLATRNSSCGVPTFVDTDVFGDNSETTGILRATPSSTGLSLRILLKNLPRPDLVLTAWLIWTPFGDVEPPIFKVANHASPCAPFNAPFSTGLSREPNELRYISDTSARLSVDLNFNPTFADEGGLTREAFCFQKDVPGIRRTDLRQFKTPDGVFIPTSSSYLRRYDRKTGFEVLDENGRPEVARSPVKALGVEVIAHVDKTTHGVSQGVGNVDHYFLIFFPFDGPIGEPTVVDRMAKTGA